MKDAFDYFNNFSEFINEEKWNERFDIKLNTYLEDFADPNLKIFMGVYNDDSIIIPINRP